MSDNVFSIPETLMSVGLKYSEKSLDILSLHANLDAFSQTLRNSLPNERSRYAIDNFWVKWSAAMLNMAADCEAIGNLLVKAAIAYLKTDKAIAKAFHGDKAEQDKIDAEIDQANKQLDRFKTQYTQEKQTDDAVRKQTTEEQEDLTLHNGTNNEEILSGRGSGYHMMDVTFRVDKDGNITEVWKVQVDVATRRDGGGYVNPPVEKTRQVDGVYFNGHWVQSGSDEAKAIRNGTAGGATSKDPMWGTHGSQSVNLH